MALARRYTEVLMSLPIASGPYYDRCNKLGDIWRMAADWGATLCRFHFEPKTHVRFLLTMLGNFRDAVEDEWKADESVVNAPFVETDAIQQFARNPPDKKLCIGGYRGRLASGVAFSNRPGFRFRTRKSTFVRYAITELKNLARLYRKLYIPNIIPHLPPGELEQTEKEVEETIKRMEIDKLLEAMEKDAQK